MTITTLLSVAGLLLASVPVAAPAAGGVLRIENSWVREAPPGVDVLAAYGQFCNDGKETVTLVHVGSADFGAVEMHETVETDGAVSMRQMESAAVGPGACVTFAPGGRHFMLIGPKRLLQAGDA
ncbi:MAG TPA: copper chaperone PCu(A)C, partial [Gammaproteobacteria bacterium]